MSVINGLTLLGNYDIKINAAGFETIVYFYIRNNGIDGSKFLSN
ncbi:hypothetical protein MASR1M107_15320 [Ignavibacteriales bacterium]